MENKEKVKVKNTKYWRYKQQGLKSIQLMIPESDYDELKKIADYHLSTISKYSVLVLKKGIDECNLIIKNIQSSKGTVPFGKGNLL